jgi:hypothetical protein
MLKIFSYIPPKIFYQVHNNSLSDIYSNLLNWCLIEGGKTNYLRSIKPDFYTIGEVWANNGIVVGYYGTLTSCFNFDFAYSIANSIKNENNSSLVNMINTKPSSVPWKFFAPFLDNHDDVFQNGNRFANEVGGSVDKQKLGAVLLLYKRAHALFILYFLKNYVNLFVNKKLIVLIST